MRILLVSTQDYIHHPIPSRHHYIFEELAKRHDVHVPHFHVSRGKEARAEVDCSRDDFISGQGANIALYFECAFPVWGV